MRGEAIANMVENRERALESVAKADNLHVCHGGRQATAHRPDTRRVGSARLIVCLGASLVLSASLMLSGCSKTSTTTDTPSTPTTPTTPAPTPSPTPTPTPTPAPVTEILIDPLVGRQVFPTDNWWNLNISNAPVDGNSNAYINFIGRTRTGHPDFAAPPAGMPYFSVSGSQARVPVTFVDYGAESDSGFNGDTGYPIPEAAKTQPHYIEGDMAGGGTGGDDHMIIIDRDRWLLFELFATKWNVARQRWEAGSGAIFDLSTNARRPEGWTSAEAAGMAIFPGLVRYDQAAGGTITHAFRNRPLHEWVRVAGVACSWQHVWRPADGRTPTPEGVEGSVPVPGLHPEHLSRDANLRSHRCRQRDRHVRHRHDGCALE